jgi:hypothetical protein
MTNIIIQVKNKAENKEMLTSAVDSLRSESVSIELILEEPVKGPIISRSPMGIYEAKEALEQIAQLLHADSIIRISVEGIVGNLAWNIFSKSLKKFKDFICFNNKQKGNAWGVKTEIKNIIKDKGIQIFSFYLDNISKEYIFDAIDKIEKTVKQIQSILGEQYINELKEIGFSFDLGEREWKIIGAEKFDKTIEKPSLDQKEED